MLGGATAVHCVWSLEVEWSLGWCWSLESSWSLGRRCSGGLSPRHCSTESRRSLGWRWGASLSRAPPRRNGCRLGATRLRLGLPRAYRNIFLVGVSHCLESLLGETVVVWLRLVSVSIPEVTIICECSVYVGSFSPCLRRHADKFFWSLVFNFDNLLCPSCIFRSGGRMRSDLPWWLYA